MIQYNTHLKKQVFDNFRIFGGVIDSTGICCRSGASAGWPGRLK